MFSPKRLSLALGVSLLVATGGSTAQTVVHEMDNGNLMVVEFNGKPPHNRRIISPDQGELYTRYSHIGDSVLLTSASPNPAGPPGKNTRGSRAQVERISTDDLVRFARFEETSGEGATSGRMWRGAPGKGHPRLGK